MHIPEHPPRVQLAEMIALSHSLGHHPKIQLILSQKTVDSQGRYLHWDEIKRRDPPKGLNHQEWWAGIRHARHQMSRSCKIFKDTAGQTFTFCEPDDLRACLMRIDRLSGGVVGATDQRLSPEDGQRYLQRSLVEEPFHSSLIEGAATTRDIAKAMIYEGRAPKTLDERMTYNNFLAMQMIKDHAKDDLSLPFILELHRVISADTMDDPNDCGRLRLHDRVKVFDEQTGDILHTPPPCHQLEDRLRKLCEFANADESQDSFMHPVMKAIILHFMLSYDHPFVDGNGRTARALFYWGMLKAGYWLAEYISISSVIAEAKIQYGQAFLKTETDYADMTYFLIHQANVIEKSLRRLHTYLDQKRDENEQLRRLEGNYTLNDRQIVVLNDMKKIKGHQLTIRSQQKRFGVSYLTARKDLLTMCDMGILKRRKQGNELIFKV